VAPPLVATTVSGSWSGIWVFGSQSCDLGDWIISYEAQVRFRIQVWVWVRDSKIFKKVSCGCGD